MSNSFNTASAAIISLTGAEVKVPVTINRETVSHLSVDMSRMNDETLTYLVNYGLRQCLNDAKAGEKNADNAAAMMEKRLTRLYEGKMTERGATGAAAGIDPIVKIATAMGVKAVKAALVANGIAFKSVEKADFDKLVAEYAAGEAVMAEATRQHEVMTAAPVAKVNIAGLNLKALGISAPDATDDAPAESADDDATAEAEHTADAEPTPEPAATTGRPRTRRN